MLIPTVPAKEFEKYGFKKCKGSYGKNGCYYLCIAHGVKMLFVSDICFGINDWKDDDPRIHKNANCRYRDARDAYDIVYELIITGMLKSEFVKENPNRLISCEERLPEEPYPCIVIVNDTEPMASEYFDNMLPYLVGYDGNEWIDSNGYEIPFEVIKWMPVPQNIFNR